MFVRIFAGNLHVFRFLLRIICLEPFPFATRLEKPFLWHKTYVSESDQHIYAILFFLRREHRVVRDNTSAVSKRHRFFSRDCETRLDSFFDSFVSRHFVAK